MFPCKICAATFTRVYNLRKHLKKYHPSVLCDVCGRVLNDAEFDDHECFDAPAAKKIKLITTKANACFAWAVTANLHPVDHTEHPQRPTSYPRYTEVLNLNLTVESVTFPDQLEKEISNFDDAVKKESILLGQSTYPLNQSGTKSLSIGISPAIGFIPIVKIWGAHTCVFFTEEEWQQLSEINITEMQTPINIGDHKITKHEYRNLASIWIEQRDFSVIVSEETFENLLNLKKVITYKLSELKALDFNSYYNLILSFCLTLSGDLYMNVLTIISSHKHTQNAYLMLECLHIYYNKMYIDFEVLKILN